MEHILEHQLKELYSLWNGINGLYTKWAQKRECHTIPYLSCTQSTIQKANAVPKGYATSGPCQSRPSAAF